MASFLLDQYLNAVSPTNFALTNPEVVKRIKETGGANLVQGFAQPDRGRRQRQGHRPAPHRPQRVRQGQDDRRDAGRGGVRERAVPADPVQSGDRQGRRRAAALRPAAGEPLLHDRPRARGKAWSNGWSTRAAPCSSSAGSTPARAQGQGRRRLCRSTGIVAAIEQVAQAHRQRARPVLLLPRRDAGRDRARLARREGPRRRGQFGDADRRAGRFLRHARLVGVRPRRRISARSRTISRRKGFIDSLELQRLFAAMRANDLIWSSVVNHYLLDKPAPPSRPALLVRGWRAHPGRLPQKLQSRAAAQQQPEGAGRVHGRRRRRSTLPRSTRQCW